MSSTKSEITLQAEELFTNGLLDHNRGYAEDVTCGVTVLDPRVPKKPYFAQQLQGVSLEWVNGINHLQDIRATFPVGEFHPENGAIGIRRKKERR